MLPASDLAHQGVDAGQQRVAVDGTEVETSAGAGGDVARQDVDVDDRQLRVVPRQLADESTTRQILDGSVPQARHQDPSGFCIRSF